MRGSETRLEILPTPTAMARRAADWMLGLALAKAGEFSVVLSGGTTPKLLYQRLVEPPFLEQFPWSRTHWFWGDERFVPHDDPESNFGMAWAALLSRAPVDPAKVHAIQTEGLTPAASAIAYEAELKSFYRSERLDSARPLFDVMLLGLGQDGHTASLFPNTEALTERKKWVVAFAGTNPEARVTLTYPTLESCRHAAFLIEGSGKQAIFRQLRRHDESLPAAHVRPTGTLSFFADRAAAGSR